MQWKEIYSIINNNLINYYMKKITSLLAAFVAVSAAAQLNVATLDNVDGFTIATDSHIPQLTEDFDDEYGFQSGDFWFDMYTYSDWQTWWGYGIANHTSMSFGSLDDQFNSCVGSGVDGSANYGLAYVSDYMGPVYVTLTTNAMQTVPGIYVTNAAYAMNSMSNGDSFAKKFGAGDWFKLTATGYDDDDEITGVKDFYLADMRYADEEDRYIVNSWEYVDLSTLGNVRKIKFTLSSTDNDVQSGMNTPAYFCFDNLGATGTETVRKEYVEPSGDPTAISGIMASVVDTEYYTIAGQRISAPQNGVTIVKQILSDGSVKTFKQISK